MALLAAPQTNATRSRDIGVPVDYPPSARYIPKSIRQSLV